MSRKRILFISHDSSRSGAPLALLALLKNLNTHHKEIASDILLLDWGELYTEFCRHANIIELHKKKNIIHRIKRVLSMYRIPYNYNFKELKSKSYNLIFANSIASLSMAVRIKQELNCKLIIYVHEASSLLRSFGASKEHLRQCDTIVAASELVKDSLIKEYDVVAHKITVIYPPSFYENIISKPTVKKESQDNLVVGLSGTGGWRKGSDLLPYVINEVTHNHPDIKCHFIWVGKILDKDAMRMEYDLERLHIRDKLTITGNVSNPIEYYNQFDIMLLLSREESFSLACAECIKLRKPIICMQGTSGLMELLGDGASVAVPYLSFKDISDAIYHLSMNKLFSQTIAEKAFDQLSSKYSSVSSIQELQRIIVQSY